MNKYFEVANQVNQGGNWLARAREWMQCNIHRGDTLLWGSGEPVSVPFSKLEDLARVTAIAAIMEDRARSCGPGTPVGRMEHLMAELQKRFPHPNPTDSTKAPELYFLEAIDKMIADHDTMKGLNEGWQMWDGTGVHPIGDVRVAYRMLDGGQCDDHDAARAGDLDWTRTDKREDWEIAAYKVIK
jgi:hypothetical protein